MSVHVVRASVLVVCIACRADDRVEVANVNDDKQGASVMSNDKEAIGRVLGFPLPDDARVLLIERESGLDDMVRAKIEMSRSTFNAVAPRLPMPLSAMTPGPGRLSADKGLWNPRSTPGVKAGQVARPGGRYLNIGIAELDELVMLFIMDHGT